MEGKFYIENPGEVVCTITISMKMKEWEELQCQMNEAWPSWQLSSLITDAVYQAKKVFYANGENSD